MELGAHDERDRVKNPIHGVKYASPWRTTPNSVRERREALELSQVALAERTSLTRQSIGAIEAGRAMPAVDVALRIARALDCKVEELFDGARGERALSTEPASAETLGRVALAHIAGRWVFHPLHRDGWTLSADGFVARARRGVVEV